MIEINVNTQPLRAAALFASCDETRIRICGVRAYVGADYVTYVATDGRKILAVRDVLRATPQALNELQVPFTIPVQLINAATLGDNTVNLSVRYSDDHSGPRWITIRNKANTMEHSAPEVGGDFPDDVWRNLIPKAPFARSRETRVNVDYLATCARAARILGAHDGLYCGGLWHSEQAAQEAGSDKHLPQVLQCEGTDFEHVIVIMPIRSNAETPVIPEWAKP